MGGDGCRVVVTSWIHCTTQTGDWWQSRVDTGQASLVQSRSTVERFVRKKKRREGDREKEREREKLAEGFTKIPD